MIAGQLLLQLLAGTLDHGFGDRNLAPLSINDRAADGMAGLKRNDATVGCVVWQAHGLSPHQCVRSLGPLDEYAVTVGGSLAPWKNKDRPQQAVIWSQSGVTGLMDGPRLRGTSSE